MKLVFALALVAVCVVLMNARPNIKRAAVERVKRDGLKADVADQLKNLKKRGAGGRKHSKGKPAEHQVSENEGDIAEEQGEATNGNQKRDVGGRKHSKGKPAEHQVSENEGDIAEEQGEATNGNQGANERRRKKRAAIKSNVNKWGTLNVKLKFDPEGYGNEMKDGKELKALVQDAVDEWNYKAGLNWQLDQSATEDFIVIKNGDGCWSYIGEQAENNQIVLQNNACFSKGVILHEIGHALGLEHEAKREDRDNYIAVKDQHIKNGMGGQFTKDSGIKGITSAFPGGNDYDYCSIMHYSATAFSKDGDETIKLKDLRGDEILPCLGSQIALSVRDGVGVAELYETLAADPEGDCKNGGYMLKDREECVCSNLFEGSKCQNPKSDDVCGDQMSFEVAPGTFKTFKTPNYPDNYPTDVSCTWLFTSTQKLCIGFPKYELEAPAANNKKCAFDWFELFADRLLTLKTESFCGENNEGLELFPDTDWLAVVFTSDDLYPEKGFEGTVYALQPGEDSSDCTKFIEEQQSSHLVDHLNALYDYYYGYGYGYGNYYGYY